MIQNINGNFYNKTAEAWQQTVTGIDGSFYNVSGVWQSTITGIDGSFYNKTTLITINQEYPSNTSRIQNFQPLVYFNLDHLNDKTMNYSVYIGNSSDSCDELLITVTNISDGMQTHVSQLYYSANTTGRFFYRVHVWDGSQQVNETFYFNCTLGGGVGVIGTRGNGALYGVAFGALVLSLFAIVIIVGKKKRR